jgi:small multidrug resistance pump
MFTIYHFYLGLAIVAEVIGTTALARSDGFTRLGPTALALVGYGIAFFFLAQTLKVMPTGIVYAVWSGMGVVFIAAIAWVFFGEKLDLPAVVGLSFIIAGVVIVNLFSKTVGH